MWLYITRMGISPDSKILHLAPEFGIYRQLSQLCGTNYISADIAPDQYKFDKACRFIDLCDLEAWPSNKYDLIINSHVLEHVPCNIAYPLFHIHRMLRGSGCHVLIIPFRAGGYDESLQNLSDDVRSRRFSQGDHVRSFGLDDWQRHIGAILTLPSQFDAECDFSAATLEKANIPQKYWRGLNGSSVFVLNKDDYKLGKF